MATVRCVFAWRLEIPAASRCTDHAHDCVEIVYSLGSSGTLHQSGRVLPYRDGTVFIYQPGGPHHIENEKPGTHICLGVLGGRAAELSEGTRQAAPILQGRFLEIAATLASDGRLRQERLNLLAALVICDLVESAPDLPQPRSRAGRVRDAIDASLTERLSLQELARRVYVSPEYLRQLFRKEFGVSITHYTLRRRLSLAAERLAHTDDPIKRIAWECGFPNEFYFSRAFRKAHGISPTDYRQRHRRPSGPEP